MPEVDLADLRAEMENEREWRQRELRHLKNLLGALPSDEEKRTLRRALVVMLYAHFEGVCRSLLQLYVDRLNGLALAAGDVVPALAAASLADVFHALRDPLRKCAEFRSALPDDSKLHQFARDRQFIESATELASRRVRVDGELIVDPESNLKPVVLRKMLYRLGFDPDLCKPWEGAIHDLLNRRNAIAHGSERKGMESAQYDGLENAVWRVVDGIVAAISDSLARKSYLRSAVPTAEIVSAAPTE